MPVSGNPSDPHKLIEAEPDTDNRVEALAIDPQNYILDMPELTQKGEEDVRGCHKTDDLSKVTVS
jgi:hypothetical protein